MKITTLFFVLIAFFEADHSYGENAKETCISEGCGAYFCSAISNAVGGDPQRDCSNMSGYGNLLKNIFKQVTSIETINEFANLCKEFEYSINECMSFISDLQLQGYTIQTVVNVCTKEEMKLLCQEGKINFIQYDIMAELLEDSALNISECLNEPSPINSTSKQVWQWMRIREMEKMPGGVLEILLIGDEYSRKNETPSYKKFVNSCSCHEVDRLMNIYNSFCKSYGDLSIDSLSTMGYQEKKNGERKIFMLDYLDRFLSYECTEGKILPLWLTDIGEDLEKLIDASKERGSKEEEVGDVCDVSREELARLYGSLIINKKNHYNNP